MQRRLIRALATSIFPLLGLAAAFAMSGCAAVPAISLANNLMHPTQPAQPAPPAPSAQPASSAQTAQAAANSTPAASPDIFGALAQHFGITLPTASAPTVQTATVPSFTTTPAATTTAAK